MDTQNRASEPAGVEAQAAAAMQAGGGRSESGPLLASLALIVVASLVGAVWFRNTTVMPAHYLLLSLMLFVAGALGVLVRRNALVLFMCIELMLNSANLAFVTFARMHGSIEGQAVVLFVMIVAAAEVAVGLAIIVAIHRRRLSANVDDISDLKW